MKHLFRGKSLDGMWVNGSLVEELETKRDWICDVAFTNFSTLFQHDLAIEVLPESVGMWIQKIDGNKNKIFVGDICKIYGGDYGDDIVVVVFENGKFLKKCGSVVIQFSDYYELNNIEVIGNITDNPEMVGEK
jgi:hypothetical protein